jgi:hypothetical protein
LGRPSGYCRENGRSAVVFPHTFPQPKRPSGKRTKDICPTHLPRPRPDGSPAGASSRDGQMAPGKVRNCKGRYEPTCEMPCHKRRPAYEKPSPETDRASWRCSRITSTSISCGRASSVRRRRQRWELVPFFKSSWNAKASPVFFRYSVGAFACVNSTLKKSPSVFWRPSRFTRCRTKERYCA